MTSLSTKRIGQNMSGSAPLEGFMLPLLLFISNLHSPSILGFLSELVQKIKPIDCKLDTVIQRPCTLVASRLWTQFNCSNGC